MDEVFARRDVLDSATLKALCRPSDLAGALQTISQLGVLTATGWLLLQTWGTGWSVVVFMVHGALLNFR